jgi:dipeptidyl aminopeptidase/acylaminoacyl peptidase
VPSGQYRLRSQVCPVTAHYAVCTMAGAAEPPRLAAIDLENGKSRILLDPNEALRSSELGRIERLTWQDKWGRNWTGVLVLPRKQTETRLPLVITSYRCTGFLRGGSGGTVPEHVLASHGIAALCINATRRPDEMTPHPSGKFAPEQTSRLQSVLDSWESGAAELVRRGLVQPGRVGVSGHSFTGEAVNYVISHSHDFAAAGSNHASVTDPTSYYFFTGDLGDRLHKGYGMPHPGNDPDQVYQQLSPALNAGKITTPLLIQEAEGESREGLQYYSELSAHHIPAEIFLFPDEAHQFWRPAHRWVMNERFIDWFRFWLQDYEDPDPAKAKQYVRWHKLREQRDLLADKKTN